MTDLKKNNILLIAVLTILVVVILLNHFLLNRNQGVLKDKLMLTIENTADINKVVFESPDGYNELEYSNQKWMINEKYIVDPVKIQLLFATVNQMSIRRLVEGNMMRQIDSLISLSNEKISFYSSGKLVKSFQLIGDPEQQVSYIKHNNEIYLMEIPGYNAYIYGLLNIREKEWRHHNILHEMPWRNLSSIQVEYPQTNSSFEIIRMRGFFTVDGIQETDTTKLTDFIDALSLLNAEEYLYSGSFDTSNIKLRVTISDVGKNTFVLETQAENPDELYVTGRLNKHNMMKIKKAALEPLFRTKNYFKP